jgi:hypothetical protein
MPASTAMPPLPPGYRARPGTPDDAPAIADLMNAYWEPLVRARKFTPEGKRDQFSVAGFDPVDSVHLVEGPGGALAAHPGQWSRLRPRPVVPGDGRR